VNPVAPPVLDRGPAFRRPTPGTVVRHLVDAAGPPVAFLLADHSWGPRWGAVVAFAVALLIGGVRRRRGEPLGVVAVGTTIVALHSASAILADEGRAFFLPEIAVNVLALVAALGSLAAARPATGVVCRRLGVDPLPASDRGARRRHRRLTLGWAALAAVHLVPLLYLYAIDSVVGLAAVAGFFNKPTMLAMVVVTVVVVRRGAAASSPAPAPSHAPSHEESR
jgi:hypothetical protein